MQNLLVALIVIACTGYAVWGLIPGTLRRAAAQQALKLRWPAPIATHRMAAAPWAWCRCIRTAAT